MPLPHTERKVVLELDSLGWPSYFPDDCPPEQASVPNGIYYRIVRTDPPDQSDFVSVYVTLGNTRTWAIRSPKYHSLIHRGKSFLPEVGSNLITPGGHLRDLIRLLTPK